MAPFVVLQRIRNALYINLSYTLENIILLVIIWTVIQLLWQVLFICNFDFDYGVLRKKNLHKTHSLHFCVIH